MAELYQPEGELFHTQKNREALATPQGLERAMQSGSIVEGLATVCDGRLRLHVDLQCAHGIIEPEEAVYCRPGEKRKDIAIVSRVGKPVAVRILSLERVNGELTARLSRRLAQEDCLKNKLRRLRPGDIIPAKVTHLESFGAFLDIGCGLSSLLSVDCISVSRIAHPRDRLACGELLEVAVRSCEPVGGRIYVTLRELLGTWEENIRRFEVGQTVGGIIRSVESYGVFVELTPNLAGLCEVRSAEHAEELRQMIGRSAAVYIKSILPDRMKIKLVLVDIGALPPRGKLTYYIHASDTPHLSKWVYSPPDCRRRIETRFDEA